jgi:hypothetical protein
VKPEPTKIFFGSATLPGTNDESHLISYLFRGEVDDSNKAAQGRPNQQADLPVEQRPSQALVDPVNLTETMSQNVTVLFYFNI